MTSIKLPPRNVPQAVVVSNKPVQLTFRKPHNTEGHKVLIYGAGGVGKTTLATALNGRTAFIDLDKSLGKLSGQYVNADVDVLDVDNWQQLVDYLNADGWGEYKNIVIDTMTMAEQLAVEHTLATIPNGNNVAKSIEDYGYGKGYGFVFETFIKLLPVLDKHTLAGRNVILICHDCQRTVANPAGDDFLRFEPRLQDPASGKASIRLRLREWCDHVLYVCYDISVDARSKKATGAGMRTIYTADQTWAMAKSRKTSQTYALDNPKDFWVAFGL